MTGLYLAVIQALKTSICCNNIPIPPELSTKRQTILRHALGSISFLECSLWHTRYFKPVLLCSVAPAIHLYGLFACLNFFFSQLWPIPRAGVHRLKSHIRVWSVIVLSEQRQRKDCTWNIFLCLPHRPTESSLYICEPEEKEKLQCIFFQNK